MKKLSLLFVVLFVTISFGQTKKKETVSDPSPAKENYDSDLTVNPAILIGTVVNDDNEIYVSSGVEVKPEFPGGLARMEYFINRNFVTPAANGAKIEGKIYASFIVEKDGSLTNIRIIKDAGYDTGIEALRVLKKMPKWYPGEQNGRKVRCSYTLPISLPLQ